MPVIQTKQYQTETYKLQEEFEAGIEQMYVLGWGLLQFAFKPDNTIYAVFYRQYAVML